MTPVSSRRAARLRRWARIRRPLAILIPFVPVLIVFLFDLSERHSRFARFEGSDVRSYIGSLSLGALVWAVLLLAASRRRGVLRWCFAGLFIFLFSASLGGQAYFFQQYNAYMNVGVARFATRFTDSVVTQLLSDLLNYLSFMVPAITVTLLVLVGSKRVLRPRRKLAMAAQLLAPFVLYLALTLPQAHAQRQPSTPDMLYTEAMGATLSLALGLSEDSGRDRPRLRNSLPVPRLQAAPSRPRNVVFVISESVRQDATCNEYSPDCQKTAVTNRLFPGRIAFEQMRALDSCTAISMAVLWSGLGPHDTRERLHTWPLLFDYARQAGYQTLYWTSQNLMFGNMRLWVKNLGVDQMFSALDIDPESHIDLGVDEGLFAERAVAEISKLREPYFLTIQLSNGHYPYLVDPQGPQPFQPSTTNKSPDKNAEFYNHYQNAIHQQDAHLGRVLAALRQAPGGERTVVVYTSDHGEAFREHHQMGHTFSLYDEEVLVPAWIDAPPGTLSDEERSSLASKRDAFVFHPDLTVTILDLLGVARDPAVLPYRAKMPGRSLLESDFPERAFPMTNCAAVWSCAFENWGMMQGSMKLSGRAWDTQYHCYDVARDPLEKRDLGAAACGSLASKSQEVFGRMPGKQK